MFSLTVVDLFCGAGGLSWGFKEVGFDILLAVDNNRAAIDTYRENHAGDAALIDLGGGTLKFPDATVFAGGPPCQGFSSAGMRRVGDARNDLICCFARIVAEERPSAFVFENVEGFLTAENGNRVVDLLGPLLEVGYRIHLRKINAANFGVPQHRKRVLAIGGLNWEPSFPEPTHTAFGAPGALLASRHLPLAPTVEAALRGLPCPSTERPGEVQGHFYEPLTGIDLERARALKQGDTMRNLPESLQHSSYRRRAFRRVMDGTPTERRGGAPAGVRRLLSDEPSKAITGGARNEFLHPTEDRNLTIRECARLQTFPDEFTFRGNASQQMQLIGNAVPPRLASVLAKSLAADLTRRHHVCHGGALLSFQPTLADGCSPALKHTVARVQRTFERYVVQEEPSLWR